MPMLQALSGGGEENGGDQVVNISKTCPLQMIHGVVGERLAPAGNERDRQTPGDPQMCAQRPIFLWQNREMDPVENN